MDCAPIYASTRATVAQIEAEPIPTAPVPVVAASTSAVLLPVGLENRHHEATIS